MSLPLPLPLASASASALALALALTFNPWPSIQPYFLGTFVTKMENLNATIPDSVVILNIEG